MHVNFLGAERWIHELDLLAAAGLHRVDRTLLQMQDFEQAPLLLRRLAASDADMQ
jgi:hypothetical protein